jgi:hypothetical protein
MSETGETSESTTETTETGTETAPDLTAELEKWKSLSKKNEERAKANAAAAKELEQLRQQSMTDQEKAVEQAKSEARAEALRTIGGRLVDASVRVAAAGRIPDESVVVLLQGLDRSKFLDENGEVDEKSVAAFVDGIAPKAPEPEPQGFPDLGQGPRGGNQMPLNGDPLEKSLRNVLGIS